MDAELRDLQRLFEEAQHAKASVRLSERNVVELVLKLQELGLLDADLLHTVSGKEYMTQEHLRAEIEAEIKRLRRISAVELAASLGVDLYHCERQVEQVIASNSDLMLVQGEIISSKYWDIVAEEVNDTLQEAGQVSIVELARHFSVGAELLTGILESQLGRLVHGKLGGGQLYTEAYVAKIKAMVCGAVRALLVPTSLPGVWINLRQELRERDEGATGGTIGEGGLFQSVLNELVNEGAIKGTLRGGGTSWIPAVFAHSQRSSVEAFFSQNGYISFDAVRKLSIPQPKQFLQVWLALTIFQIALTAFIADLWFLMARYSQAKYPESIALETVFVHQSYISLMDAAAEEAIDAGGWFDALQLVPSSFGTHDTVALLSSCLSVQKALKESRATIMAETCVVSSALMKMLMDRFEKELLASLENSAPASSVTMSKQLGDGNIAENQSRAPSRLVSSESQLHDTDEYSKSKQISSFQVDSPIGKKMDKKQKADNGAATSKFSRSEMMGDDAIEAKTSRTKKKAGKVRGGKNIPVDDLQLQSLKTTKGSSGRPAAADDSIVPSEELMLDKIIEWFPDITGAGVEECETGRLANSLAATLRPSLMSLWSTAKQAKFGAKAEARRHRVDSLLTRFNEAYLNFQLFSKALDLFDEEKSTETVLHRHLLRTTASEITDLILRAHALEQMVEDGETSLTVELLVIDETLSTAQRLTLAKSVPPPASSKAVAMVESLDGKNVQAFESALQAVLEESGRRFKRLDKKTEKPLLQSYHKDLALQVEKEADPVTLLPKVVALLFVTVHNRAIQIPGRAIAATVAFLQKSIPDNAHKTLMQYQAATVALLSMLQTSTLEESDCTSDRIREKEEFLVNHMAELKKIALSSNVA
ncbi:hypothetical protein O6H91_06G090400 [Diphasiastrum complanatum]|uniref:Uncharacterized protein n=1 Tax=Diphasiastrum complanatum TaxID=34168 RepID=A0ACC2DGI6_DIPCM|nr:hypothetical protein O6H91_06G090400 [Diphasiastrum complanatum]